MKITTWNVNGIRAALNKGLSSWIAAYQPDILCLQEVKARLEQVVEIGKIMPGGRVYWNSALQPGYSGVATFANIEPLGIQMGIGEERFDSEGRVIRLELPQFILYNVYFPNGQRGQARLGYKLDFYARLLEECDQFHAQGRQIIITGDFNTAHREIDLANPKQNATTSGFLPEERIWIDTYLSHGFVDIFRELNPEQVQYTWWTYRFGARERNIGWRLDYYLISRDLIPHVQEVVVHQDVIGSDHCPVTLVIG